jgi:YD repeat-containing protein
MTFGRSQRTQSRRIGAGYEYDYENRVVKVKRSDNTAVAEYVYDALGRRIKKVDSITSGNSRYYYYNDRWQCLRRVLSFES